MFESCLQQQWSLLEVLLLQRRLSWRTVSGVLPAWLKTLVSLVS